jgi:uncharacterized membrane protein
MSDSVSKPTQHLTTIQTVEYKGILPPPEMLRQFKELDPTLPGELLEMTKRSFAITERNLDIDAADIANQAQAVAVARVEAETKAKVVEHQANYDLRAQIIILTIIVIFVGAAVLLAERDHEALAAVLATGGLATMISNAIRGVSGKKKSS